ncbi:MAG: cysteine synthase CysM [Gammaproteobacteria bacterium]|nr:cysteine synthase CysM [Gammaproteobacteria bacterium]
MAFQALTIEDYIGNTPLVLLRRLNTNSTSQLLIKLEGNNPAGSVKDRAALNMILQAEKRGEIKPGDTIIEATSGNTGIALAMVAAIKGYKMILILPEHMTLERRATMAAYGAKLLLVTQQEGMEGARDLALKMEAEGEGKVINQFSNDDNPNAHYTSTGPELWQQTNGEITHFVSSMGTTGTIVGTSRYLKEKNNAIEIIGVQPADGATIPGSRKWPAAYLPEIFTNENIDTVIDIKQDEAEDMTRALATVEGVFCGVSSGAAVVAALKLAEQNDNAVVVAIIADRGDRYLSSGIFPAE